MRQVSKMSRGVNMLGKKPGSTVKSDKQITMAREGLSDREGVGAKG